jgi:hypothetical protein
MSLRSYEGLLVLEDIFDYIPTTDPDIVNLANSVFSPNLKIIENDCGTTLGLYQTVTYAIEGKTELSTDEPLSKDRIDQLLFNGTYQVALRSTSTCISSGGICAKCYSATFPRASVPVVNSRVTIYPEYTIDTDVLAGVAGQSQFTLSLNSNQYTFLYVYHEGLLLVQGSDFTLVGTTLTLTVPLPADGNVVARYTSYNRAPFLIYLAEQYSGSILGMNPLPRELLPIRSLLLISLLNDNILEIVAENTIANTSIPNELSGYISNISDPLEKALYILALQALFANLIP